MEKECHQRCTKIRVEIKEIAQQNRVIILCFKDLEVLLKYELIASLLKNSKVVIKMLIYGKGE